MTTNQALDHAYIDFATPAEWEAWLKENYTQTEIWLRIAKKGSGKTAITIPEALDVALCYGWIDSHRKGLDASYYLQRYSPRRSKSPWSLINVEKAEALIAAKRMQAPGYAEITLAKTDGRWNAAYESQRTAPVPEDLRTALALNPQAQHTFEQLDKSGQYAIFLPILKAVSEESRALQIQKALTKLTAL
jgi:uncharacterized protein YdeI (YjbR/CyaY-like superfamily)